jgi:kynurenine formamidase
MNLSRTARALRRCSATLFHYDPSVSILGSGLAVNQGDVSLETYVLGLDRWQIELLADLNGVPASGALIVASLPKPNRCSGFPARVFAIF